MEGHAWGAKVRALRRREGLTQARLAGMLGISASYLNLIEHDKRPLTAALLVKLAQRFEVDLRQFAEDDSSVLASDLLEVLDDPLFEGFEVTNRDVQELTRATPSIGKALLTLYRAWHDARESLESLASLVADGQEVGVSGSRLPSEEVTDFVQRRRNHFPELEQAAEQVASAAGLPCPDRFSALQRYAQRELGIAVRVVPGRQLGRILRRYDPVRRELSVSEVLEPHARDFQIGSQLGLVLLEELLLRLVDDPLLSSETSKRLCRMVLANHFAGALLMPYALLLEAAEETRYDVELLERRFGASFEQVCHRLTCLRRPGQEGVPFHFVKIDTAGNITKRFSGSGIRFARFGGACPRWNVNKALTTGGQLRTQLSRMPDGSTYFCVARPISKRVGGYNSPEAVHAVGLGCDVEHANKLVYADGLDLQKIEDSVVPIGVTCRACDRSHCEDRAFPSLSARLNLDENVRGAGFYTGLEDV